MPDPDDRPDAYEAARDDHLDQLERGRCLPSRPCQNCVTRLNRRYTPTPTPTERRP